MRHNRTTPPQLCSAQDCDASLRFDPKTPWPEGLPAVAVNQLIFAGWGQDLVFNHSLDTSDKNEIANLFRSLYFELSFGEIAHLAQKAKSHAWFPLEDVIRKFNMEPNAQFMRLTQIFLGLPKGFQTWCIQRKVSAQELLPLMIQLNLSLKSLYLKILNSNLSRSQGMNALEIAIDLYLLGKSEEELHLTEKYLNESGAAWCDHLKQLRFPEAAKRDWPGTSQARWSSKGKKAGGLELTLFVSEPSGNSHSLEILEKAFDKSKPN